MRSPRAVSAVLTATLLLLVVTSAPTRATEPRTAAAQPYLWRNVETVGGGFVPGIVYNETEAGLVYARTDIGGAYRRDPVTQRWIPLLDHLGWDDWNLTGVASLATDPVDPNRVYAAVGTYTNDWTDQNGAVLRSTDRGTSWQRSDLPFKLGANMPGRSMGERLAVDPNRNNILYLGSSRDGLWRSTDSGATWSTVASFPNPGDYVQDPADPFNYLNQPIGIVWVTFDKRTGTPGSATQSIYVAVADAQGTTIYRSPDAGVTWQLVPGQPTAFCCAQHGVLDTVHGSLYITYSNTPGPYDGSLGDVWRHDIATGAWTRISPMPSDDSNGDNYFGYGGITVDRQNPTTIMVSSFTSWWPDEHIWRSRDRGATWTRIWDWTRYPNRTFRYTQDITAAPWLDLGDPEPRSAEVSPKLGWMVGDLEIDPFDPNRMLYGTGATIYGSDNLTVWDSGGTITLTVKAQGLEETAVNDLVSPPAGAPLLSALGDVAGFRHNSLSVAPASTFRNPNWPTSTSLDFAELNPSFAVRVGNADVAGGAKAAGYSTDGGTTWAPVSKQPTGVTGGGTVAVSANGTRILWSPAGTGVYVTANNGKTWTAATGIPAGAKVAADRVNSNKYYGYAAGNFYVSTNAGGSFLASAAIGLPGEPVRLEAVPGREGDIWLAGGSDGGGYGLWHSTDSGATFARLSTVDEADTVGFGKAAPGRSYPAIYASAQIGGVRGIYRSDDVGATWVRINDDQHQYGWTGAAITGDPRVHGRVYLGTNGRGIVYGDPA
jgi:photosystem II stability/assembly factor-like uncharacterized protein